MLCAAKVSENKGAASENPMTKSPKSALKYPKTSPDKSYTKTAKSSIVVPSEYTALIENDANKIPQYGFKRDFNHKYPETRTQGGKLTWRQIWELIPLALRYILSTKLKRI